MSQLRMSRLLEDNASDLRGGMQVSSGAQSSHNLDCTTCVELCPWLLSLPYGYIDIILSRIGTHGETLYIDG